VVNNTEALAMNGFPAPKKEKIYSCVGLSVEKHFAALAEGATEKELQKIVEDWRKINLANPLRNVVLFPGVKEVLETLNTNGKILVIATSNKSELVKNHLSEFGISNRFRLIVSEEEVDNNKPSPDMVDKILEITKIPKEDTMLVGDMDYDILMGKNAGISTCAVKYGIQNIERLKKSKPDFMISDIKELLEIID